MAESSDMSLKDSMNEINTKLDKLGSIESLLNTVNTTVSEQSQLLEALTSRIESLEKHSEKQASKIAILEKDNFEKNKKVAELENKLDELEQYSKIDNVIISGLAAHSYSTAASTEIDTPQAHENVNDRVLSLFNNDMKTDISKEDISAIHYLNTRNNKKNIIVRFISRATKNRVMTAAKNLKGRSPRVFVNEHLTQKTSKIYYRARQLRAENRIENTWTKDCKVFIKCKGDTPEQRKIIAIKEIEDLLRITGA